MRRLAAVLALCVFSVAAFAQTTAIVGGKVHTVGPQGTIENATILIVDGKIRSVGTGLRIPANATTINADGKLITPGLFSPIGRLGLVEVGLSAGPVDSEQRGEQFTAGFDVADAYNRRSTLIPVNRIEGITRAAIVPSPGSPDDSGSAGHVLSGLAAIVNLGDDDVLDRRGAAMVVTLGQSGSAFAGGTRSGAWLTLRNALEEAADYRDHKGDVERGMRREYQHSIADLEALQSVIAGDIPLLVRINRAADIEVLIEITDAHGLKAIIYGGSEAWMVADKLAAARIPVILAPNSNLPGSFDSVNARRGAANLLVDAGVRIALADSQSQTHNARNITQSAGNAVADGLDWDAALRAITLAPAQIYGVADSVGSIEAGKSADIVIWPADPFELTTYPDQVLINGVVIPMISRQTLLRDRYLQTDSEKPPAYRD
ncbi:MAG: amidohydrolase family protein [Gammaproteobacteria bacterium]|nr:amidohydrolase family protein [Gammaproteobacteria bacterium]NNC56207.1 amidohydrolase family protein [Woeseiaceae bacterium]NNL49767.1 amidohydrolase family protein [Woeseiaceae bacterium]